MSLSANLILENNQLLIKQSEVLVDSRIFSSTLAQTVGSSQIMCSFIGKVADPEAFRIEFSPSDWVAGYGSLLNLNVVLTNQCFLVPDNALINKDHNATGWGLAMHVINALNKANVQLGERVCVLGSGLLSYFICNLLKVAGIYDFTIPGDNEEDPIGNEFDLIIDATGSIDMIQNYSSHLIKGGTILLLGDGYQSHATFNFYPDIHQHSIRLIGYCPTPFSTYNDTKNTLTQNSDLLKYLFDKSCLDVSALSNGPVCIHPQDSIHGLQINFNKPGVILNWPKVV